MQVYLSMCDLFVNDFSKKNETLNLRGGSASESLALNYRNYGNI